MSGESELQPGLSKAGQAETLEHGGSFFARQHQKRELQPASQMQSALFEGTRVGVFVLKRFIAQGGLRQAWEAADLNLKRTLALKFVLPECVDEHTLKLFAREARASGRMVHPNLVRTLAFGENDGHS